MKPELFASELRRLRKTLKGLPGTDDRPIARRNARKRVLQALRIVRGAVDREYPALIVRGTVRRLKTTRGREKRLAREGWCEVTSAQGIYFASLGIRIRKLRMVPGGRTYYAPSWAVTILEQGGDDVRLLAAKKSRSAADAMIAAGALAKGV